MDLALQDMQIKHMDTFPKTLLSFFIIWSLTVSVPINYIEKSGQYIYKNAFSNVDFLGWTTPLSLSC